MQSASGSARPGSSSVSPSGPAFSTITAANKPCPPLMARGLALTLNQFLTHASFELDDQVVRTLIAMNHIRHWGFFRHSSVGKLRQKGFPKPIAVQLMDGAALLEVLLAEENISYSFESCGRGVGYNFQPHPQLVQPLLPTDCSSATPPASAPPSPHLALSQCTCSSLGPNLAAALDPLSPSFALEDKKTFEHTRCFPVFPNAPILHLHTFPSWPTLALEMELATLHAIIALGSRASSPKKKTTCFAAVFQGRH
ncbi:hypothetical protein PCANC_27591 [Puccinia coronata f. sp. avenae]|uniref:Uncharacterized protein n=1 Tax=Puccinia coronata f. sp. avenae TaxID=200324 RepID=A0A2N5S0L3_9BASI|nr:hypothetical protein PCANC_27591 [Puccinia coronata f. sp. avenae]